MEGCECCYVMVGYMFVVIFIVYVYMFFFNVLVIFLNVVESINESGGDIFCC